MADPNEKKPFTVMQNGRDGAPLDILGQNYQKNDTIWLTEDEAKYLLGLSIERAAGNEAPKNKRTAVGEHGESGVDVVESTRMMKEMETHVEEDRADKRVARSIPSGR